MNNIITAIKNKVKEMDKERFFSAIKFSFEIITIIATVASMWMTYQTLQEMRIERRNTYLPNPCFMEKTYQVYVSPELRDTYTVYFDETSAINDIGYGDERNFTVELTNIGVGTMEDVTISVTEDECIRVLNEFRKQGVNCIEKIVKQNDDIGGNVVGFVDRPQWDYFTLNEKIEFPYILANAEQIVEYRLPSVYSCLIYATILELDEIDYMTAVSTISIPDITVSLEYTDVQGVRYNELSVIETEIMWNLGIGFKITVSVSPCD